MLVSAIDSNVSSLASTLPTLLLDANLPSPSKAATASLGGMLTNGGSRMKQCRRPDVDRLSLHSNQISRIDDSISQLFPRIRYLDLSSNMIERIECLSALHCLEELNLSNNLVCISTSSLLEEWITLIQTVGQSGWIAWTSAST
jgi:Leucine-rich repeat (LRR) protein